VSTYGRDRRASDALRGLLVAALAFDEGTLDADDLIERIRRWVRRGGTPTLPVGPRKSEKESRMKADQEAATIALVVADAVFSRREELGWTQQEFADAVDVPGFLRTHAARLERGTHCPTLETLYAVARALETTPGVLLGGHDEGDADERGEEGPGDERARPSWRGRPSARRGRREA
jgi:transcriptional regulator with XRE-family HTH domain